MSDDQKHLSLIDVGSMIDMADAVISRAGLEIVSRQQTHVFHVIMACKTGSPLAH